MFLGTAWSALCTDILLAYTEYQGRSTFKSAKVPMEKILKQMPITISSVGNILLTEGF